MTVDDKRIKCIHGISPLDFNWFGFKSLMFKHDPPSDILPETEFTLNLFNDCLCKGCMKKNKQIYIVISPSHISKFFADSGNISTWLYVRKYKLLFGGFTNPSKTEFVVKDFAWKVKCDIAGMVLTVDRRICYLVQICKL